MSFMFIAGGVALGIFLLSYLRSGRFGSTALALGAGYIFALLWADTLSMHKIIQLPFLSWDSAVQIGIVVIPGLLALLFSHKQKSLLPRVIASLALAVLVVVLLLPLFSAEPQSQVVYMVLERYQKEIISALLGLGLLDMIFSRTPKPPKHSKD